VLLCIVSVWHAGKRLYSMHLCLQACLLAMEDKIMPPLFKTPHLLLLVVCCCCCCCCCTTLQARLLAMEGKIMLP
jgi:hypothetical protein